jgi:hypothetical protein
MELLSEINDKQIWKCTLFTLEIGARGLVALSTSTILKKIGFKASEAKALCRRLSLVVARCSYAVYLAHNNLAWSHGKDLLLAEPTKMVQTDVNGSLPQEVIEPLQVTEPCRATEPPRRPITVMRTILLSLYRCEQPRVDPTARLIILGKD